MALSDLLKKEPLKAISFTYRALVLWITYMKKALTRRN